MDVICEKDQMRGVIGIRFTLYRILSLSLFRG